MRRGEREPQEGAASRAGPAALTRAERQERTREALVHAAREVFAREGYHGAQLEAIAREAGFSKGAVYSNFPHKAALFLAVMDLNIAAASGEPWDPFARVEEGPPAGLQDAAEARELEEAMRGIALATLEFIATAARDEALTTALSERVQVLLDLYAGVAARSHDAEDPLSAEQIGLLLAALDQGLALLALSGVAPVDHRIMRTGMRRMIDPRRAHEEAPADDAEGTVGGIHDAEVQRRIAASARGAPPPHGPGPR